jgi:phosphatidylglycerophosphatase A
MIKRCVQSLLTLGPIGFIRGGGTIASFITLPLIWIIYSAVTHPLYQLCIALAVISCSWLLIYYALDRFGHRHDPSEIVIDEVAGIFLLFIGIAPTIVHLLIGCALFRFFDISKIAGIATVDSLRGSSGIMLDDCLAVLYAYLLLRLFIAWSGA